MRLRAKNKTSLLQKINSFCWYAQTTSNVGNSASRSAEVCVGSRELHRPNYESPRFAMVRKVSFSFCLVVFLVIFASHFRARMDLPEKKFHLESGLNQRDRTKKLYVGGCAGACYWNGVGGFVFSPSSFPRRKKRPPSESPPARRGSPREPGIPASLLRVHHTRSPRVPRVRASAKRPW